MRFSPEQARSKEAESQGKTKTKRKIFFMAPSRATTAPEVAKKMNYCSDDHGRQVTGPVGPHTRRRRDRSRASRAEAAFQSSAREACVTLPTIGPKKSSTRTSPFGS